MDNADTLDRVRRGKESVTDKHSVPPANLDAYLLVRHDRWQWIRELKSGTFDLWEKALVADLDEALRRLRLAEDQIQLYKLQPERTSDVAALLREAGELLAAYLDGSANYETRNDTREWLRKVGLDGDA